MDVQLDDLAAQVAAALSGTRKTSLAVIAFSNLDGTVTELGQLVSEELLTRLVQTRQFKVVERKMLNQILREQKLQASGLIDEESIKKLGKILGIEAILSGTVSDLGATLKINARLVNAETGIIFGAGSVSVTSNGAMRNLAATEVRMEGPDAPVAPAATPGTSQGETRGVVGTQGESTPWMNATPFGHEMQKQWDFGYYPARVDGRMRNGVPEFRASLRPFPRQPFGFFYWFGIGRDAYDQHRADLLAKGFQEIHHQTFQAADGAPCFQTCWMSLPGE